MRNLKLPKLKFRVADSDRSATAKFKVAKYKKPGVVQIRARLVSDLVPD